MFSKVEDLANHLNNLLRASSNYDYWSNVASVIESLPIYATGDNYCFEVRRFEELDEPPAKLFALPAADLEDHWESIAFAQTALDGMAGNETLQAFSATLRAARVEIVKSRMFCVAHHVFWATEYSTDVEYASRVKDWLAVIGSERIGYADESYFRGFTEPASSINRGRATWLLDWLRFRYDTLHCPVSIDSRYRDPEADPDLPPIEVDRSIVLAAAAFTWQDYALVQGVSVREAVQLTAAAGQALFLALQSSSEDDAAEDSAEDWGRRGGLERHRHTRALKDWALAEAERMTGSDRSIARDLAARLPPKFTQVSEDPSRLIYDAIRARRVEQKGRRSG